MPERFLLSSLLDADHVFLDVECRDAHALLDVLAGVLAERDRLGDDCRATLVEALVDREALGSTVLNNGVALPHGYVDGIAESSVVLARLKTPVPFTDDAPPVDLVFLLSGPPTARTAHVKVLARLARLVGDAAWLDAIRRAETPQAVIDSVRDVEGRHA